MLVARCGNKSMHTYVHICRYVCTHINNNYIWIMYYIFDSVRGLANDLIQECALHNLENILIKFLPKYVHIYYAMGSHMVYHSKTNWCEN